MSKTSTISIDPNLVAPCGIHCRYCMAHMREKNPCPGCRVSDPSKPKTRQVCKIKTCEKLAQGKMEYCYNCDEFPCERLVHLDQRYRAKYGTSNIDNLRSIQSIGISKFIENEKKKWTCPECAALMCMHKPQCPSCGYERCTDH